MIPCHMIYMPLLASHDEHQLAELAFNSAVRPKLALPMLRTSDRQWARLMITTPTVLTERNCQGRPLGTFGGAVCPGSHMSRGNA